MTNKKNNIQALESSLSFFSNKEKLTREKWVVKSLLNGLNIHFNESELVGAEEPIDVSFRDTNFQVKEILDSGRHRTDGFRIKLEKAKSAKTDDELDEYYTSIGISFSQIVQKCYDYALTLVEESKYGKHELKKIDLLCYFNWIGYNVIKPLKVLNTDLVKLGKKLDD